MKVHVDMNLCQSHGECVTIAPDVFELGDDDVLVWQEDVDDDRGPTWRLRKTPAHDGDPARELR